jgi:hypothetical protein
MENLPVLLTILEDFNLFLSQDMLMSLYVKALYSWLLGRFFSCFSEQKEFIDTPITPYRCLIYLLLNII